MLLVGLPASGKSTLARKLTETEGVVAIEFDKLERELDKEGSEFSIEHWQAARDTAFQQCSEALVRQDVRVVVMDDNFYYRSMRKRYFHLARELRVGYLEVHLEMPVEEAMRRNKEREVKPGQLAVPEHVIVKMASKLEPPAFSEHALVISQREQSSEEELIKRLQLAIEKALVPKQAIDKELTADEKQTLVHEID